MKKSAVFAGAIVVAAAAYTGVSWYVGWRAEETIRAAVDRANDRLVKTLGPDLGSLGARLEIVEYRRGLFSSNARYTVLIRDGDDTLELGMADDMQHGPFPWSLLKEGVFTPVLAHSRSQLVDTESVKRWFDAARGVMPLELDTRIGFGGDGRSTWRFAPLEWSVEADRLSFSGGEVDVHFSNDFRDSEAEGRFDSFVVGDGEAEGMLSLNDVQLRSETRTAADDSVQVHSTLQAATLALREMDEETVAASQVSVTFDSRQQDRLLDAALRYDLGSVRVGQFDLGSLSVGGKVARFDFEAFSALMAEYDAIAKERGAEEGEDFELEPNDEERLLARLRPALATSPEFRLEPVVWRNDKGESTLVVTAAFQPLPVAEAADDSDALLQALREMRFEFALSRPMFLQAFVQTGESPEEKQQLEMLGALMFDRYVGQLEEEGLVRREGDRAYVTVVYGGGEVDVNGEKMSPEEFMLLFGGFLM